MNKIYDKLFFVLALLLLLGSLAFYLAYSRSVSAVSTPELTVVDHSYAPIQVAAVSAPAVNWLQPEKQSTGWIYDVFTPPKIYLDESGRFVNKGWEVLAEESFGVYLAALERQPYRIQLEGYIEEDITDASKSLLLLFNEESQRSVRARVGDINAAIGFEVLDFKIDRLRDANGNPYRRVYAVILDQHSGQQVILKNDERLYQAGVTIKIRSEEDASLQLTVNQVGDRFETSVGKYVVEAISIEELSITIKKMATANRAAEIQQFFVSTPIDPASNSGNTSSKAN
jgi:hypothetical protein